MPFREATLITSIRAAIKKNYPRAYCRKISDRCTRGIPDLVIIFRCNCYADAKSAVLFVETKTLDGTTSAIQDAEHHCIERAGGTVIVARSVQRVLDELESMGATQ
jgi:hypothetical protein